VPLNSLYLYICALNILVVWPSPAAWPSPPNWPLPTAGLLPPPSFSPPHYPGPHNHPGAQLRPLPHLHVPAARDLGEQLLVLQGLVHAVVRHAEAAQPSLDGVVGLGEDHKLGHVGHADDLAVHLRGEVDRLVRLPTVNQPEPAGAGLRVISAGPVFAFLTES